MIVDFLELDHMRETIDQFCKKYAGKLGKNKRKYWDASGFYVGRTIVKFKFSGVTVLKEPIYGQMLVDLLQKTYGADYHLLITWTSIKFLKKR